MPSESIYNLVPQEPEPPIQRKVYHAKTPSQVLLPGSTFGCRGSTRIVGSGMIKRKDGAHMGPPKPETGLPRPTMKLTGSSIINNNLSDSFQYTDRRKDTVPSKEDRPICGIITKKNFITANAVEAILMVPRQTTNPELNYMKKDDFGKVPAYLSSVKEEIKRENELIENYIKKNHFSSSSSPSPYEEVSYYEELSSNESDLLLDSLKTKWDLVNSEYQKITHLVKLDTTGQIRRKEALENQLNILENDIQKLEKASAIYIKQEKKKMRKQKKNQYGLYEQKRVEKNMVEKY